MQVTLIAATSLLTEGISQEEGRTIWNTDPLVERWMLTKDEDCAADTLAEFAGRACYQSFDKPNPATAENKDYIANIIKQQHFSVLEHASATFYITGVSRALTHELIRHRHLSYSQLSQRFVDGQTAGSTQHPALDATGLQAAELARKALDSAQQAYAAIERELVAAGKTKKQAREAARMVLPNSTETKIVVTGNMRAWREFIVKRNSTHADAEIQLLAQTILEQLKNYSPNTFEDM